MESRAKLAGHAVHPMLVTLPLGLLGTAVIFDIIRAFTDDADFAVASFYMLAAGIIGGLLAGDRAGLGGDEPVQALAELISQQRRSPPAAGGSSRVP